MKLYSIKNVSGRWFLLGICLVVLAASMVVIASGEELRYGDELQYSHLAVSVLHGHGFTNDSGGPSAFRPPGYPVALAAVYAIVSKPLAAKMFNVLLLGALTCLLAAIAVRINPNSASFTPYFVLACPVLIYSTSVLYPQVIGSVLFAAIALMLTRSEGDWAGTAVAGLLLGLLSLAIPSFLMMLPLFLLYFLIVHWPAFRTVTMRSLVLTTMLFAVLAPWIVRNYVAFGELVPVSSVSGLNLMIGNSALTTPNGGVDVDIWSLCPEASPAGLNEVERDDRLKRCAIDWIVHNPGAAAQLYVEKVINYFNYRNEVATQSESAPWKEWLSFATYYPLLLAALLRLACIRRMPLGRVEMLIYILYFGNAFISAVFFTRVRFRIPYDALMIPIVTSFVVGQIHWLRNLPERIVGHRARGDISSLG